MKNHKELFEALLAGEILTSHRGNYTLQLLNNNIKLGYHEIPPKDYLNLTKYNWKIKPKTININGFEVPEPCKTPLPLNTIYFIPMLDLCETKHARIFWSDRERDNYNLTTGLVHLTPEAAELHAKALLSFTEVKK